LIRPCDDESDLQSLNTTTTHLKQDFLE
jgi:hypothetical protein